jgi:hypothetical protein
MKVSELIKALEEMDGDTKVMVIKQIDAEYQEIRSIEYISEKHPIGGVTIHTCTMKDDQ